MPSAACAAAGLTRLPTRDLDVAFALGESTTAQLDGIARYGVWRFCFGATARTPSAGRLREAAEGRSTRLRASACARHGRAGAPRLPVVVAHLSVLGGAQPRPAAAQDRASSPARALRELHRSRRRLARAVPRRCRSECARRAEPTLARSRAHRRPASLRRGIEKALRVEQWFLAYRFGDADDARRLARRLHAPRCRPKDRYWADPFAIEKNGRHFVFFEELPYARGQGAHRDGRGDARRPRVAAGARCWSATTTSRTRSSSSRTAQLYMIPESGAQPHGRGLPLRRLPAALEAASACCSTACAWSTRRFHRGDGPLVDVRQLRRRRRRVFDDELHLFHAEQLLGEWKPHRRNPVKSDARCARPAGRLFWRNGALYRPAQICVPRYGAGIAMQPRDSASTPEEYTERQVERILPAPQAGLLGMHTINRAGELTVVDAFARRRRFT